MNGNEFLHNMEYIDADLIEAVGKSREKSRVYRYSWAAAAACAGLLVAAGAAFSLSGNGAPSDPIKVGWSSEQMPGNSMGTVPGPTQGDSTETDGRVVGRTSDTYSDLPELLAYLGEHESHGNREDQASGGKGVELASAGEVSADAEQKTLAESRGVAVTTDGRFAYHIGDGRVFISRLDGKHTENVGTIEVGASDIFICNSHLILVSEYCSGGNELDREMSVRVGIYDVSKPENPALLDEYTQRGERTVCWMSGADLYLVTSDGVCACGWSRLSDTGGYYPALAHNGENVEWGDDAVAILGEPTRVQYSAVTVINSNSCVLAGKCALYGNIRRIFYGDDWIAVTAAGETETYRENPIVYTFNGRLKFTGKMNPAQIVGVGEKIVCEDYVPKDGTGLDIVSIAKADGVYRLLGSGSVAGREEGYFLTVTVDMNSGESRVQKLSAADYPRSSFTEIRWEKNRVIVCVGVMRDVFTNHMREETRFIFAEYDGLDATFYESGLTADYLSGRVGIGYGNTLGQFDTLISMGDGIYLRYTKAGEGPGGFDVFDFSDSSSPKLLYRAEQPLCGDDAFDYVWSVYDKNTFGTLKVLLGEEVYFRNVGLAWDVYSVDPAAEIPVTFQAEQDLNLEVRTFMGADGLGFAVFDAGDQTYYVTKDMTVAQALR